MEPSKLPTTGQVARDLGVSERRVQDVLRAMPDLRPPLFQGKRRWSPSDVAALRERLAELDGRRT